ncbi:MAG: hypothetical protein PVJ63_04095 [Thioalkalispiraceae bacterium]|jgi:Mrp family chromosome partitioning ATPase
MSKIEDALKKAYESGLVKYPGIAVSNDESGVNKKSSSRNLVTFKASENVIARKKQSIKEIAQMKNSSLLKSQQLTQLRIISPDTGDDKIANSYRDLRTKIIQKTRGKNAVVLVTSCTPGAENSLATLNLATAFSFDQSKTSLVVDCNFQNPQIEKLLKINTVPGLVQYLESEDVDVNEIIHETGIKRLRLIPAGKVREVETEYFTSHKMKTLMNNLFARYPDRYVFINSRPIDESADTRILTEMSDYVLLVVPYGKATSYKINESVRDIDPEKFLGVVFVDKPTIPKKSLFNLF